MSTLSESIAFLTSLDHAVISLFGELQRQGLCHGPNTNERIITAAETQLGSLWKQVRALRECSDKQLAWIKNAMIAIHPECDITADPESLVGKTLRFSQTPQIERLKEINDKLIEANEELKKVAFQSQEAAKQQTERADKLQAQLGDWHQICDELWKRGYGQLPQRVNETPLGSCLRLIEQGTPDSSGYWGPDGKPVKTSLEKNLIQSSPIQPVKIPLKSSDLPLGAAVRFPQDLTKEAMILGRDIESVWISGHGSKAIKPADLMAGGAEYRLPGSDEWKPCYKLVNPTPHAESSPKT